MKNYNTSTVIIIIFKETYKQCIYETSSYLVLAMEFISLICVQTVVINCV